MKRKSTINNNPITIINGAIRKEGNTDSILNKLIESANKSGMYPNIIVLRDKQIGNCTGCYKCLKESRCSQQDDMTEIRSAIENAKLLILASPLYWCGVTGLMKTFIDRLFFYYHSNTKNLISGKEAIILTTMNQRDVPHESEILVEFYKRLLDCLGVRIIDMFFFSDIMEKGVVLDKQEYLDKAFLIGKRLNELIGYKK